eukprot:Em0276g5a
MEELVMVVAKAVMEEELVKQAAVEELMSALTSDLSPLALAMAQRPVLLPDPFDGEKTSWPEWETHFKHVAVVNKWESADEKLKWLRVRLTGKALAAFSRCSEDVRNDYGECMKALAKRFNPDSKREVYVAELHSRNRRKEEDWATYADILKGLADKAYPDLEEAARERLALNQFLSELDKPQVAFGVRQGRPKSLDEAVSLTIELESYIGGSHGKPARVNFSQVDAELPNASASTTVAEEQECSGVLAVTLHSINERLQRLELRLKNSVVCSVPVTFVIDTGAAVSLINNCVWNQIARAGHVAELQQWIGNRLVGVNGSPLSTKGFGSFDIVFGNKKFGATLIVTGDITVGAILGLDFLENHKCCIDCGAKILTFPQNKLSVQVHHVMPVKVEAPHRVPCHWTGVMVARSLVCTNSSSLVPIRLLNSANNSVVLKKGMKVASMSQLHEDCTTQNISAVTEHIPLSQGDQEALWSMVCKTCSRFNSGQIGRTNILKHRIDTGNTPPVHLLPRRIPQSRREEMAKLVKDMLEQGAIQQSDSPWSSPVVLVKKKTDQKDAYPLPRVDDTLDTLAGWRLFTTLDLASGYWQVEVAEEDQPKTAFTTPEGLFQFRVMPFGLCNAPATFQRLMDRVLGGLKWSSCLVYLDDIIIVGTSFSEHLRNLAGVLQRLRQAGLKLKPSKCKWCQKSVTFLGHIVSEEGVAADPSKTAVVAGWPPPQSKREMQQFLGLANYYRKFVKNFAAIAKPLHRLTEKNTDFKWTVECQHAFDVLRACLSSPPVLSYPDYSRRFVLDTDASDIGIGAVLSQEDATGSEGSDCICQSAVRESHETTPKGDVIEGSVTSLPCTSYTPQWIRQQQLDDCSIRPVYQALESKLMLSADEVKPWSRESRLLWQQHTSLYLKDGVLWRRVLGGGEGKLQLVVPAKLRQDILRSLHEGALSAHLGEEKMRNLLKERFYWPSCADDVSEWCSCCAVCCSRKTHAPKRRAGLQTLQVGYQEAATVARKLVDEMFCRFSPPEQLHSDQGRQFESELVKEVCKLLEIKKTHTTPYHPQCNGIVERFNRTLLGMLATTVDSYPSSWEQNIRRVCLAYNSSVHASTGFSPFFLMFGRQVKLPVDLMYGTTQGKETAVMEYVKNLKDGLLEAYALVRDRCETEHKRQKSIYDRKLYHLDNPGSCTGPGKDPIKWWKGSETPPTSCKVANEPRLERPAADEVVLPTPKPGEQCELLEEDEDYAAPVAPPNELPAAGPGDQPAPQRRYPDRNRRQPDRYGPFIKH